MAWCTIRSTSWTCWSPMAAVLTCSPDQHPELFHGFPNSYGSLGYATRVRVGLIPVSPGCDLEHTRYSDPNNCSRHRGRMRSADLRLSRRRVFRPERFRPEPRPFGRINCHRGAGQRLHLDASVLEKPAPAREDYLSIHDYLWRWDTDWFWCSKNVGAHLAPVRLCCWGASACRASPTRRSCAPATAGR
jgi:hypothetical protein